MYVSVESKKAAFVVCIVLFPGLEFISVGGNSGFSLRNGLYSLEFTLRLFFLTCFSINIVNKSNVLCW